MPTVLVTGANRGLGLEFVEQYCADGWNVIACCRDPDTADELNALARTCDALSIEKLDIADFDAVDALAAKLEGTPIDVLLNNAGMLGALPLKENFPRQRFGTVDYDLLAEIVRTNTFGPVKMAEAFVEHVAAGDQKKIVSMSSVVSSISRGVPGPALGYCSSKSALNRAMTIIAENLRERGIIVALFCPGHARTRMDPYDQATVEPDESIAGIRAQIDALTPADSGSFHSYDSSVIEW